MVTLGKKNFEGEKKFFFGKLTVGCLFAKLA